MKKLLFMSLFSFLSFFSCRGASCTDLDINAFQQKISDPMVAIIDVRSADEYTSGHLRGACNYDWFDPDFAAQIEAVFPKSVPLALYCRTGRRSTSAAAKLVKSGYTVYNMLGGYVAWAKAGKPVFYYDVETFVTDGGIPVQVSLIKHGSLALSVNGVSIQVDPVREYGDYTDYARYFPKADVILVTHEHQDHLDGGAIKALWGDRTRLIINQAGAEALGRGEVMGNGGSLDLPGGIKLDVVPAYNTTPGREKFHPKGNGNGYVLTVDGFKIYIAGDTEDIPEMAEIKDVDLAFLPVNQPYTMTVEQCVNAVGMLNPKVLIPYHFSQTDISSLPMRLQQTKVLIRNMR